MTSEVSGAITDIQGAAGYQPARMTVMIDIRTPFEVWLHGEEDAGASGRS